MHIEYVRADGRNVPGVDVPYAFDGGATATITPQSVDVIFELVRHSAKLEAPLMALANHALQDFDPRKLTHDDLERLRDWRAGIVRPDHAQSTQRLIDILAAALPPRHNTPRTSA